MERGGADSGELRRSTAEESPQKEAVVVVPASLGRWRPVFGSLF